MTRTAVSAVVVHYHAAELAARAVESLRREAGEAMAHGFEVDLEVLLVDNGSDETERQRLAEVPGRVLDAGGNLGYAGGANLGAAEASGEVLLLANPDVELLSGALARLLAALAAGADVAGPRFVWDRAGRLLLPPAERRSRRDELAAVLAERGEGWARFARRRWRRHARRHWLAERTLPSVHLSGALLALRRSAWQRTGAFDEGYRLYFEESDWLRRAERAGLRLVHEPRAEVLHHYNRSAAGEPRAAGWFAESAERFARRWYGAGFRRLRDLATPAVSRLVPAPELPDRRGRSAGQSTASEAPHLEPPSSGTPDLGPPDLGSPHPGPPSLGAPLSAPPRLGPEELAVGAKAERLWVELSPALRGFPAAAERLPGAASEWVLPEEVWRHLGGGRWRLALVGDDGRERGAWGFTSPGGNRGGEADG